MNSVPKLFSCSYADCWTENHFSTKFGVLTPNRTHSHTLLWGCVSRWFGRALAWHARGQRFDPAILHQKSTVLRRKCGAFLFAEAGFFGGGVHCFACTVFRLLQATQLHPGKRDAAPGADRAKQSLGKLWGQHNSFYGSVRCGCRDTPPMRHTRRAADGSRPAGRIRRSSRRSRRPAPPRGSGRCSPFPVRWPRGHR